MLLINNWSWSSNFTEIDQENLSTIVNPDQNNLKDNRNQMEDPSHGVKIIKCAYLN